jgi:hypothetical protein
MSFHRTYGFWTPAFLTVLLFASASPLEAQESRCAIASPDSTLLRAVEWLRTPGYGLWGRAELSIWCLMEEGFVDGGSQLQQALADSLLSLARTHPHSQGRSLAIDYMGLIDKDGTIFSVARWVEFFDEHAKTAQSIAVVRQIAGHPNRPAAARGLVEVAERQGTGVFLQPAIVEMLLEMDDEHGRAGLQHLRHSPAVIESSVRRRLEELERRGYRRDPESG